MPGLDNIIDLAFLAILGIVGYYYLKCANKTGTYSPDMVVPCLIANSIEDAAKIAGDTLMCAISNRDASGNICPGKENNPPDWRDKLQDYLYGPTDPPAKTPYSECQALIDARPTEGWYWDSTLGLCSRHGTGSHDNPPPVVSPQVQDCIEAGPNGWDYTLKKCVYAGGTYQDPAIINNPNCSWGPDGNPACGDRQVPPNQRKDPNFIDNTNNSNFKPIDNNPTNRNDNAGPPLQPQDSSQTRSGGPTNPTNNASTGSNGGPIDISTGGNGIIYDSNGKAYIAADD